MDNFIKGQPGPWNLLTASMAQLKRYRYEVAIISTAATEAHNLHLPEGQDVLHASHVACEAARIAFGQTQSVIAIADAAFWCGLQSHGLSPDHTHLAGHLECRFA